MGVVCKKCGIPRGYCDCTDKEAVGAMQPAAGVGDDGWDMKSVKLAGAISALKGYTTTTGPGSPEYFERLRDHYIAELEKAAVAFLPPMLGTTTPPSNADDDAADIALADAAESEGGFISHDELKERLGMTANAGGGERPKAAVEAERDVLKYKAAAPALNAIEALENMPDLVGTPDTTAYQRSSESVARWYCTHYQTLREALKRVRPTDGGKG